MARWPLQPLQPLQKTQLQPPVGPSVDLLCHPWVTTINTSYRFPIFETSATTLCGTTGKMFYPEHDCMTWCSVFCSMKWCTKRGLLKTPFFKTPCRNCYWGWSIPIMLDYRDISLMENVPLLWRPMTASPVEIEPMTILESKYITPRILRFARTSPPIPPMIVLKHGELR